MQMQNGMAECKVCGSKTVNAPVVHHVSRAYDRQHTDPAIRFRALKVLLVVGDCILIGLQPILVYISKVDGKFLFSPVSVNFLTEVTKVIFALCMILWQVRRQRPGEKSLLSPVVVFQAARANYLLAVPALLYAINNYLKFTMQLYFQPSTVKMLGNLKVLVIALLLKGVMKRRFSVMQWEALGLLLIGISVNQLHTTSAGTSLLEAPLATAAYLSTLAYVTVPSLASVYNEYALKSQFDTSVHLQNLFLYGYGALFNLLAILAQTVYHGGVGLNILEGHSHATMLLICNNAAQDTILKKYSSTVATIFTGLASFALFGHALTINFLLGVTIVFISMHQFFSSMAKPTKSLEQNGSNQPLLPSEKMLSKKESSMVDMTSGATEDASHTIGMMNERERLLPL